MNNPDKGMYPILGYDKDTDSKILIGGFGNCREFYKGWRSRGPG
jgi:hypothetical protein